MSVDGQHRYRKLLHPRKRKHPGDGAALQGNDDGFAAQLSPASICPSRIIEHRVRRDRPGASKTSPALNRSSCDWLRNHSSLVIREIGESRDAK
jgi:hypothetical protein